MADLDVTHKIISTSDVRQGASVVYINGVSGSGQYYRGREETAGSSVNPSPTGSINDQYTNRFDDPTYYG